MSVEAVEKKCLIACCIAIDAYNAKSRLLLDVSRFPSSEIRIVQYRVCSNTCQRRKHLIEVVCFS